MPNELIIILSIVLFVAGLIVLYYIIESAVKNGINKSFVGQFLDEKCGMKDNSKSFLNSDLDNDK